MLADHRVDGLEVVARSGVLLAVRRPADRPLVSLGSPSFNFSLSAFNSSFSRCNLKIKHKVEHSTRKSREGGGDDFWRFYE